MKDIMNVRSDTMITQELILIQHLLQDADESFLADEGEEASFTLPADYRRAGI